MRIKKLVIQNIEQMYNLGLQEFRGQKWYYKKFIKDTFRRSGLYLGAFDKNKLIGVLMLAIYDKPKSWIYFFVVDKKFQRKGIGTKLLKHTERKLPRGYFLIFVDIGKEDIVAKKFYVKNGFKRVVQIKDWFGKEHDGLIYCKRRWH